VFLDNNKLEEIEKYYEQCAEEGANEYQIEESKKAITKMEIILGDNDRLQAIAEDFVSHYETRVSEGSSVEGKAMFVCANRMIAYNLYKKIIALRPQWAEIPSENIVFAPNYEISKVAESTVSYGNAPIPIEKIKLVMTRNKDDEAELYNLLGGDEERKKLDVQFKNPKSNFKIAIVVDMWITGFDVPCLDTMYIDKPLQHHTLIQTISRVNRVYKGKEKGLVVDYIGLKSNLNTALKRYTQEGEGNSSVEAVEKSIIMVKDELDILRRMFANFDYTKFSNGTPLEQLDCLNKGAEFVQTTEERENLFMGHTKKLKSAFNLCCNREEISFEEKEDIYFFCGVRSIIYKITVGGKPDVTQMNKRVSVMIEEAILSESVEEIIKIGNEKENLDLLSVEYMEKLAKLPLPNTKVKLMERLLRMVISEFKTVNMIKGVDFSERLNLLVKKYNERKDSAIFAEEVLNEVAKQMAELLLEVNKEKQSFKDLGISYEEKAFFDILIAVAKQFTFDYPEDKAKELAKEIKNIVDDKSKYTDWANRDDIKSELKMDLIIILDKYGYPPVTNDAVYKGIFEQAENFKKYH
jgi:type I restriction enzyme R subunit